MIRYEPALSKAEAAVDGLVLEIIKRMDKPFAFFGRELGSQVRCVTFRQFICVVIGVVIDGFDYRFRGH